MRKRSFLLSSRCEMMGFGLKTKRWGGEEVIFFKITDLIYLVVMDKVKYFFIYSHESY